MADPNVLDQYRWRCENEPRFPDLADFMRRRRVDDSGIDAVNLLLIDQYYRHRRGVPLAVERYFEAFPKLRAEPRWQIDLVRGEILSRKWAGEPCDIEDWLRRFPELHDSLLVELATLPEETVDVGEAPTATAAPQSVSKAAGVHDAELDGYSLLVKLGEGGMGVVYLARDLCLDRTVALKMIRGADLATEAEMSRFLLEARACARLEHESIVRVYEFSSAAGRPYFTMEYVDGASLEEIAAAGPLSPKTACGYLLPACRAIAYAHRQGVLHRDLKPSNLLLSDDHTIKVADFGLAKFLHGDKNQTQTGQFVGTACYISPEQARGDRQIGPEADVYSLGATLYRLVAGRPPFQAASPYETVRQVIESEIVPARVLNPHIDRDVDTICAKCLEKSPGRRYRGVDELADDIERYLDGEPILARPVNAAQRFWRRCRRNPWPVAVVVLLIASVTGVAGFALQSRHNRQIASLTEYHSQIQKIRNRLLRRGPGWREDSIRDLQSAAKHLPHGDSSVELRSLAVEVLSGQELSQVWSRSSESEGSGEDFPVMHAVAFSPTGEVIACANGLIHPGTPGKLHLIDAKTGSLQGAAEIPETTFQSVWNFLKTQKKDGVRSLAFSPDNQTIAAGMRFGRVFVWRREANHCLNVIAELDCGVDEQVEHLVFSNNSQRLYAAAGEELFCWNADSFGSPKSRHFGARIGGLCFLTTPEQLLIQADGIVLLDPQSLKTTSVDKATSAAAKVAAESQCGFFAAGGETVFVGELVGGGGVQLPTQRLSRDSGLKSLMIGAGGRLVAAGRNDGTLAAWFMPTRRLIHEKNIVREFAAGAISPRGDTLAATGNDGVQLYSLSDEPSLRYVAQSTAPSRAIRMSPTGRWLAALNAPADVASTVSHPTACLTVWDVRKDRPRRKVIFPLSAVPEQLSVTWRPDESGMAIAIDGVARMIELAGPDDALAPTFEATQLRYASDGGFAWSVAGDRLQRHSPDLNDCETVWRNAAGRLIVGKSDLTLLEEAAGWCVAGSIDGKARLFDCRDGKATLRFQWPQAENFVASGEATAVAISEPPRLAALGTRRGLIDVVSIRDGTSVFRDEFPGSPVTAIAFGDGGRLLVAGAADGTLKLWRRTDKGYSLVWELSESVGRVNGLCFANADILYIARDGEYAVACWDLHSLEKRLSELGIPRGL